MGILMHDMHPVYWKNANESPLAPHLRLKLEIDPLSCVLTLADTIQDFERHTALFTTTPTAYLRVRYPFACTATEVEFHDADATLSINYVMVDEPARLAKNDRLPGEQRLLFDPDQGFVNLASCGINRVTMTATTAPPL
jgi:hypothetical protein